MMNDEMKDFKPIRMGRSEEDLYDEELRALLESWKAPAPPASLDVRAMAAYRKRVNRFSFWKRLFAGTITVPVPVAVAVLLLLMGSALFAFRAHSSLTEELPPAVVTAPPVVVEVPVVREKIVTRAVYIERQTPKDVRTQSHTMAKERSKATMPDLMPEQGSHYFTKTDLKGFEPVREINIRILGRSSENEK